MNNVIISGEVVRTNVNANAGGKEVTNLAVKVTRTVKGEEWTDGFFDVTVWNRMIPLTEGQQVIVQGTLRSKKHYKQDADGKDIYMPQIDATFGDVIAVDGVPSTPTVAPSEDPNDVPF